MTTPFAAEHMAAEISRLRVELEKANEQSEHFERQWYLRGDEIEALNAKLGEQQSVPEWWEESLIKSLVLETERAINQRDKFLETGISTSGHGGSHDTCFAAIVRQHIAMLSAAPSPVQSAWKLVPVELLEELRDAANEAHNEATRPYRMKFFAALVEKADAILGAPSAPEGAEAFNTPAEFLAYKLMVKRSEILGRPLTWRESIELIAITTNMPDADKARLLALDGIAPSAPAAQGGE